MNRTNLAWHRINTRPKSKLGVSRTVGQLTMLVLLITCFSISFHPGSAIAQVATGDTTVRDLLESAEKAEELVVEKTESVARGQALISTPLTTVLGIREAMKNNDFEAAAKFLDMRYLPEELEEYSSEELVKALAYVYSRQNIIDISQLSDEPGGHREDGLPSYRDKVGTVSITTGDIPIYLQHVPGDNNDKVWKFSNATVAKIPEMWDELGYSPAAIYLSKVLPDMQFMGMDNWQIGATVIFFIFAWPTSIFISYLLMRIALQIPNRFPLGIKRFFRGPMRVFIFLLTVRYMMSLMGLSLTARILLESSGFDYIAYTILLLGLLSLMRDYQIRKMQHAGNVQYVALLKPFTTIVKILVVTVIALFWADSAGYNMSTILAGLGVGSLAVALAAQKTMENLIGAVTLYAARPVSAGDFCRFGKVSGTVEEIGLRSTTIRTLDRTMVVIPNAVFSSVEIENFSKRDRIRYYRKFRLQLCSAEQIRYILAELRRIFLAHPQVIQESVSIRFENIEDANAILRLDAGIPTTDFQVFLAVAEDLNLHVLSTVQSAGALFSGPGQVVQLREFEVAPPETMEHIEETLNKWREQDKLPFPNYSPAELDQLKGSLEYPPKGSGN